MFLHVSVILFTGGGGGGVSEGGQGVSGGMCPGDVQGRGVSEGVQGEFCIPPPPPPRYAEIRSVNQRSVRILLECILVQINVLWSKKPTYYDILSLRFQYKKKSIKRQNDFMKNI